MTEKRTKTVKLRMRDETRTLIDRAVQVQRCSRSDFIVAAARRAAEDVILDQTVIVTDRARYDRFLALLDRPPQSNEKLRKLMQRPAPSEQS